MENNWLRYSCQLKLPGFSTEAQQKLQSAKVLIVGAGGLGCPAALYLAASGIGTLALADFDVVSTSNLHRQVLYGPSDVGLKKVIVACERLKDQNPASNIISHNVEINCDNAIDIISRYDIVIDATDNFETKYLLNDACVISGKPLVYGAIYQYEGQLSVWNAKDKNGISSPNYRDVFPEVNSSFIPNCNEGGVLPTLAGIIGTMQANEVIKYITNVGELLAGKLLIFDALTLTSRIINIGKFSGVKITSLQNQDSVELISMNDLSMHENEYTLIDVRSLEERDEHHIGGIHIPIDALEEKIYSVDISKPIVFYCATGNRSAHAVKKLKGKITTKVYSLKGGLKSIEELRVS